MINTIESTKVSELCDYSFGDQAGIIHGLKNSYMMPANIDNKEFIDLYNKFKSENKSTMTLFIDNIRLYNRPIASVKPQDISWVNGLMSTSDLLNLCSQLSDMNFIIFTGHEDTPIDNFIFEKIPNNVISIFAVNAESFGGKVFPFPYGLQRKLNDGDDRLSVMDQLLSETISPKKLLYVNHNIGTNITERTGINEIFQSKGWATVDSSRVDYKTFLSKIQEHKFMICPIGNAIDCHRNWEVLYLKRVPVMKKHKYLEKLFEGFPVLFVDDYNNVTENLLKNSEHLFEMITNLDFNKLDLNLIYNKCLNL
jgi:hypothetical protein